jgi:hypothetical protein
MYQLLQRAFAHSEDPTVCAIRFRRALEDLRQQNRRAVVLLAVTDEKFESIRGCEFGVQPGESLSADEVRELSGFDDLYGPEDLKRHLAENNGECKHLLYVRSSDPQSKLRDPGRNGMQSLLDDPELRTIIRANSITLNIDGPEQVGAARINDTKAYLQPMRMGIVVGSPEDLVAASGALNIDFERHLLDRGIEPELVVSGKAKLRAKPLRGTYGCYGHSSGPLNAKFRAQLRKDIQARGEYVIQPELPTPTLRNISDGQTYTYIDRVVLSCTAGKVQFVGGMRTLMLSDALEAKKGRIHGSHESVFQEIRKQDDEKQ